MPRFSFLPAVLACALAGPARADTSSPSAPMHDAAERQAIAAAFLAEHAGGSTTPPRFAVTTLADAGPGSLRNAIEQANAEPGFAVVEIDAALQGRVLLDSALYITDSIVIIGPGADRLVLDADGRHGVIATTSLDFGTVDVAILGVTVRGGANPRGAGIASSSTNLLLVDAIVEDNNTTNSIEDEQGGGLYVSGGSLRIDRCTVRRNTSGAVGGGLTALNAPVSIRDSAFQSNIAKRGGGLYIDTPHAVDVRRSLIALNKAVLRGAGIDLSASGAEAVIENTTISSNYVLGNQSTASGAGMALTGSARVILSTIASNYAWAATRDPDRAAGLQYDSSQGILTLNGTLLWGNATLDDGNVDLGRSGNGAIEAYHNLIGATTPDAINRAEIDNLFAIDPLLGPLADNGGPTLTHAIAADSPARDAATWLIGATITDQRGFKRRRAGDAIADIGAYEHGADRLFANGFDG